MAPKTDLPSKARRTVKATTRDPRLPKAAAAAGTAGAVLAAGKLARDRLRSDRELRSYRFVAGEPVPDAVRRVARGRVDHALGQLRANAGSDRETAIHEVRKDMKKLRSLLRLMRAQLGKKAFRRENDAFREAGRRLSGARDAEVMLQTLDKLEGSPELGLAPDDDAGLRDELEQRRRSLLAGTANDDATKEVRAALKKARSRIKSWPLQDDGFDALDAGLRRSYRRGRHALQAVEQDPSSEALHEWRKRVKDLWYHLRLLAEAGAPLSALTEQADALAEGLGEDHDLAVLSATAAEWLPNGASSEALHPLRRAIEARRNELQAEALALGRELYADRPRDFTKRVRELWRASPAPAV